MAVDVWAVGSSIVLLAALATLLTPPPAHIRRAPQQAQQQQQQQQQEEVRRATDEDRRNLARQGTSFTCTGSSASERVCRVHNLCYHTAHREFVALKSPLSLLPASGHKETLLDLIAVLDHNVQHFTYAELPASHAIEQTERITVVPGSSLIFMRFNPTNIMHVLHEDLLPLFATMQLMGGASKATDKIIDRNIRLVHVDAFENGPHAHLSGLLSDKAPLGLKNMHPSELVCFEDAHVGTLKTSIWYQYGFTQMQGPIVPLNLHSVGQVVRSFKSYVYNQLNVTWPSVSAPTSDRRKVALFTRTRNRLIINEKELIATLTNVHGFDVVPLSMETHSFEQQVQLLGQCAGAVGMHGSMLIMGMFLPAGSFLLELFPFAVPADNYTPYKTMCSLPELQLTYLSWTNHNESNTITYPDRIATLGGIRHLNKNLQQQVLATKEVKPHLCCVDPVWLYRIYQDTFVNTSEIDAALKQALSSRTQASALGVQIRPSRVRGIACKRTSSGLEVSWRTPWNVAAIKNHSMVEVQYEVLLFEPLFAMVTDLHSVTLSFRSYHAREAYQVLVRCGVVSSVSASTEWGPQSTSVKCV